MKNVIMIFLIVLIPLICANDNITCTSHWYSDVILCLKNREIIYVNQIKHINRWFIAEIGIDSIAPNAFWNLSIRDLELTLPQTLWGDTAVKPLRIQPESFEGLRQVKKLIITQGNLQLEHNIFAALESLESLIMENCRLKLAKNGSFTGLLRMRNIIIRFSKSFEMLPGIFTGLEELRNLYLYNNNITTVRKNIFNHMKQLDILDLSWNKIDTIQARAFDGISLKILYLESNQLTVIPIGAFDGVSIDYLILHGNQIIEIEANAFGNSTINELQYTGRYITIDKPLVGLGKLTKLNGDFEPSNPFWKYGNK